MFLAVPFASLTMQVTTAILPMAWLGMDTFRVDTSAAATAGYTVTVSGLLATAMLELAVLVTLKL